MEVGMFLFVYILVMCVVDIVNGVLSVSFFVM